MTSSDIGGISWFGGVGLEPLWHNYGSTLRSDFPHFLGCCEAKYSIFLIYLSIDILTTLEGLAIASMTATLLQIILIFGSLA